MSAGQADLVAEMKGWRDAKLDALVKEMNSSTGETKTNAIAAVVNELVSQHKFERIARTVLNSAG